MFYMTEMGSPDLGVDADESIAGELGMVTGITRDELDTFKHDAVTCINESLLKKIQEIEQVGSC